jgi:hypothetical protein
MGSAVDTQDRQLKRTGSGSGMHLRDSSEADLVGLDPSTEAENQLRAFVRYRLLTFSLPLLIAMFQNVDNTCHANFHSFYATRSFRAMVDKQEKDGDGERWR